MNRTKLLNLAIDNLAVEFSSLDLTFYKMKDGRSGDVTSYWPGGENEDIVICVFKGKTIHEPFHRQDFFFINYAYRRNYQALSYKFDNLITVRETGRPDENSQRSCLKKEWREPSFF